MKFSGLQLIENLVQNKVYYLQYIKNKSGDIIYTLNKEIVVLFKQLMGKLLNFRGDTDKSKLTKKRLFSHRLAAIKCISVKKSKKVR